MIFKKNIYFYLDIIIFLIPLFLVLGPTYVNIYIFLLVILFFLILFNHYKNSFLVIFSLPFFRYLLLFWFYICLNSFFSTDIFNALRASLSFGRFILVAMVIGYFGFRYYSYELAQKVCLIIISLVVFDILFQFIFGADILGYRVEPNRFSGPFGKELVAGAYLYKISPIILSLIIYNFFFNSNFYNKILSIFFVFVFLFTILITGERTSFLLTLIFLFSIIFLAAINTNKKKIYLLISSFFLFFLFIFSLLLSSVKIRYLEMIQIVSNFYNSSYGKLWNSGYRLWLNHPLNGVGLKNFRVDCDIELADINKATGHQLCSTHPHNFLLELLSETGLVGTSLFILFIANFYIYIFKDWKISLRKKEHFVLFSLMISIFLIICPIFTSGSFYTTWNGSFLWVLIGYSIYIKSILKT